MRRRLPDRRSIRKAHTQAEQAVRDAGLDPTPERVIAYLCLMVLMMSEKVSVGYARCGVSSAELAATIKTEREALP